MSTAESFNRSAFARFVNSSPGRVLRVVAGVALVAWGYSQRGTGTGLALMLVGLLPLAAGALDWCFVSALLGGPLSGKRIRGGS